MRMTVAVAIHLHIVHYIDIYDAFLVFETGADSLNRFCH